MCCYIRIEIANKNALTLIQLPKNENQIKIMVLVEQPRRNKGSQQDKGPLRNYLLPLAMAKMFSVIFSEVYGLVTRKSTCAPEFIHAYSCFPNNDSL